MEDYSRFEKLSPTFFADVLPIEHVMGPEIRPLWPGMKRIAGPAFTVRLAPGDHLMLHAAIYRAAPGSIIVVQGGDYRFAVSGGNVCAAAHQRGITGFVVDGMVRDIAEAKELGFPLFARGISPKPGGKERVMKLNEPIICGGILVSAKDIIVADEEGIMAIPGDKQLEVLEAAEQKAAADDTMGFEEWRRQHEAKIAAILNDHNYMD